MSTVRQYGAGAIGTALLALASILFSNLQTTRDLLVNAQQSGGAPKMIADLMLNPAFQVILVAVAIGLGIKAIAAGKAAAQKDPEQGTPVEMTPPQPRPSTEASSSVVADRELVPPIIGFEAFRGKQATMVLSNTGGKAKLRIRGQIVSGGPFVVDHQAPYEITTVTIKNGDSANIVLATYHDDHTPTVWVNTYDNLLESWIVAKSDIVLTLAVEVFHVTDKVQSVGRRVYRITSDRTYGQLRVLDITEAFLGTK